MTKVLTLEPVGEVNAPMLGVAMGADAVIGPIFAGGITKRPGYVDILLTVELGEETDPTLDTATAAAQAVLDAHDPDVLTDAQQAAAREARAETDAANIPGWARWTETEVLDYIDTNVTDLASAKVVLTAMARLLVALRNKQWPNLEGSG